MRQVARARWSHITIRLRRSDLRGTIKCVVSESGVVRTVEAEAGERICRRVDCARVRAELGTAIGRLHDLESAFDMAVATRVQRALRDRDATQAEALRKLAAHANDLQQRLWRKDHVRVKTCEWVELHRQHQGALAEISQLRAQVAALGRKLVLSDRKSAEATSACTKATASLATKRKADSSSRSQVRKGAHWLP